MFRPIRHQSGFTMVEIAAVMVIAGLIYGSVLKNQGLVESASAKRLANDFQKVTVAVRTYQDQYRNLPGDDRAVADHLAGGVLATTPAGSIGNHRIDGDWNSLTASDESFLFWQHLRLARLLGGTTDLPAAPAAGDGYIPRNGVDGRLGVTSDIVWTTGIWPAASFTCSSGISGALVRRLDAMIDDGNTLTGGLRALCEGECAAGPGVNVSLANEAGSYTVCAAI